MKRSRNFCITYNNYEENTLDIFKTLECVKYAIFGKEMGESGTPHLQGYVQLKNAKTVKAFQSILKKNNLRCAVFVAKGNWQQNVKYCSKDDNVVEFGIPKKQGNRVDLEAYYADIKDGKDDYYLQENHTKTYARYHKAAQKMRQNIRQHESVEILKKEFETVNYRPWQEEILKCLENQGNRKVDWVVDTQGNKGKTWLAKYLMCEKNAFYVQGGKTQDIAYAYNYEEYVVFDFTRSQEEFVNYSTIESFKNGLIFSPKYESITKKFGSCKVLCLSNWMPNTNKLSQDRWRIRNI